MTRFALSTIFCLLLRFAPSLAALQYNISTFFCSNNSNNVHHKSNLGQEVQQHGRLSGLAGALKSRQTLL